MGWLLSKLLGRFSVGHKLALIYLLDLTAVIYISGILIHEKYIAIDFARKEIAGNNYIAAAAPVLIAASDEDTSQRHTALLEALPRLRTAEEAFGISMSSADAHRALIDATQRLDAEARELPTETLSAARLAAIEASRRLITRVGNQSNLILDPDLDTYYTMSLVLLRYPELVELVSQTTARMRSQIESGRMPESDARSALLMLEGQIDAVANGIKTDAEEAFAATVDPLLKHTLSPAQAALQQAINQFRGELRRLMDRPPEADSSAALRTAQTHLLSTLRLTWQSSGQELHRLIQVRIDGFFMRMWMHLGTAAGLLVIILSAVFFVARKISVPLRDLAEVAETVRKTGDHTLRAEWSARDEIGRLVVSFNEMLAQLDRERRVQQELAATTRAAEAQQRLVEAIPIPLVVTSVPDHEVLHANQPAAQWLGGRNTDPWAVGLESSVRARFFQQLADHQEVGEFEVNWRAGAEPTWAVLSARRLQYQGRDAVLTAFTPVNLMKAMEQRLELWAKVFEASSEGIVILDADGCIVSANRAFCRHTQHDQDELRGRTAESLLKNQTGTFLDDVSVHITTHGSWQGEVEMRRRSGGNYPAWLVVSAVPDAAGRLSHYILTSLDISERKASEQRIQFLAQHDVLTSLPNRSLSNERLMQAMQRANRTGQRVAVLFIDLDRFKNINDSLGHHMGDALLRSVAERLTQTVRDRDTVSRMGGDEFVVVLNGVIDAAEVRHIVESRLVPRIRQPHVVDGIELNVSCSVGVALYPDDAQDIDELMRHADVAMYQAKSSGRDNVHFFSRELNERAQRRLSIESLLRHAVERDELQLHYQPRVDARTGRVLGVEGLLRWSSPEMGRVSPGQFIPIAEESKLIVPIGAWVINEACRQMAQWRAEGHTHLNMSVNVSALQLREPGLLQTLREALARHGLPPTWLELELTESTLMDVSAATLDRMNALRELGVRLSVDDFGTGYSSLNYLSRFPIDMLKIDRSFVQQMLDDEKDLAITRGIIALGHSLGLRVVAEGVESEEVAQALRQARCDELQGFLYARPMPAAELKRWLAAQPDNSNVYALAT